MSLFDGFSLGDSLSLPSYDGGGSAPATYSATTSQPTIFGQFTDFGKDLLSGYFDLKGQQILLGEQAKILEAQNQQNALLGAVEQPQNTNAYTYTPEQLAALAAPYSASGGGGGNNNTMLVVAVLVVAYLAIK